MAVENYYQKRINQVVKYIDENLSIDLNIRQLAKIAGFSSFHFQRIYKALQGESPYDTLLRLRLEKAVFLLKYRKHLRVSEIAYTCGFNSHENFTRQFKDRFGLSPSAFKKSEIKQNSRIYQETHQNDFYTSVSKGKKQSFDVKIETLNDLPIAFIRAIFAEDGSLLVQRYLELIKWAEENNHVYKGPMRRFGMSVDNVDVTPAGKYRYDFALVIDGSFKSSGLIEKGRIEGGSFATVHVKGNLSKVAAAWDYLYKSWLPESGYVPRHQHALEEFIQGPEDIGWETFNLNCRIPLLDKKYF